MDVPAIDISELLERKRISGFLLGLVVASWLVTFFDGLDSNMISFAAPYFGAQYHLSKIELGNIFSVGLLGTLIGGFILGYVGDWIGRRPAIIWATIGFGVLTLAFTLASNYRSLLALRLLNGIPLGGLLPLAWALNIEYASKRFRATIVTVIMIGYSFGTGLGGQVANAIIPRYGWKALFIFGSAGAFLSAAALLFLLPESIRFLASKERAPEQIRAILRRMAPEVTLPESARFVVGDEIRNSKAFSPSLLFRGELRRLTPLIWLAYVASSFAVYFIVNWTPLLFESLKYPRAVAANAASLNSLLGGVAGMLLMRFTDRRGAIAITVMPVMTFCLLLAMSFVDFGRTQFLALEALTGAFLIGGHFGMHSICGLFYPSSWRANGVAWATSVAKVGSVTGPLVGGWVLSTSLPVRHIFVVLAICPAVFGACIYAVSKTHSDRLGRETPSTSAEPQGIGPGRAAEAG